MSNFQNHRNQRPILWINSVGADMLDSRSRFSGDQNRNPMNNYLVSVNVGSFLEHELRVTIEGRYLFIRAQKTSGRRSFWRQETMTGLRFRLPDHIQVSLLTYTMLANNLIVKYGSFNSISIQRA